MALIVYNVLMIAVLIIGLPIMLPYLVTTRKRRKTVLPRLNPAANFLQTNASGHPPYQTIWVHALSLGEVLSAVPLVHALEKRFGRDALVFSASTLSGFETAEQRVAASVRQVFFFPYDLFFSIALAVRRVKPDLVIIVETDLWPNFMARLAARQVPVLLVNARLSDRSTKGYRRIGPLIRPLLRAFRTICVQSRADADRFQLLGARAEHVLVTGNLKFDIQYKSLTRQEMGTRRRLFQLEKKDRVIVAGSTHPGEEEILLAGFDSLIKQWPALRLILAPRDPGRAGAVKALAVGCGLAAACLSELEHRAAAGPPLVIVIDRIGILAQAYALGDLAFVGGSLVRAGGHNPLEPAACGKPVLFGPDMSDFRSIAALLIESGGAGMVSDEADFTTQVTRLLRDKDLARTTGQNAHRIIAAQSGAVHRTMAAVVAVTGRQDA